MVNKKDKTEKKEIKISRKMLEPDRIKRWYMENFFFSGSIQVGREDFRLDTKDKNAVL